VLLVSQSVWSLAARVSLPEPVSLSPQTHLRRAYRDFDLLTQWFLRRVARYA
jgi:hypothetical protein